MLEFNGKFLIGMIHLPSLLEYSRYEDTTVAIQKALADLQALEQGGFDAALITNEYDHPHTETINNAQFSYFLVIAHEVCKQAKIPVGVEVMLNDWRSSISIAKSVDAKFTRVDTFADDMISKWCHMKGEASKVMSYCRHVYPELTIFADVQQAEWTMVKPRDFTDSVRDTAKHAVAGIVVTGGNLQRHLDKLRTVHALAPHCHAVTSGAVNIHNIQARLALADIAIIGRGVQTRGKVDIAKVKAISCLVHGDESAN